MLGRTTCGDTEVGGLPVMGPLSDLPGLAPDRIRPQASSKHAGQRYSPFSPFQPRTLALMMGGPRQALGPQQLLTHPGPSPRPEAARQEQAAGPARCSLPQCRHRAWPLAAGAQGCGRQPLPRRRSPQVEEGAPAPGLWRGSRLSLLGLVPSPAPQPCFPGHSVMLCGYGGWARSGEGLLQASS